MFWSNGQDRTAFGSLIMLLNIERQELIGIVHTVFDLKNF